ncbi:MAG: ribosomal protein S18-alanine N-acetyltransferase [Thermodesulfobacteriota bacterium]|nr:ribosomal protein S18-alanine N-acetyltransferase [Thermodesulfobacteriota bacterium]
MIRLLDITLDNLEAFQSDILKIERSSFSSPWSLSSFIEEINRPVSHLWALTIDEKLSGYICFWMFADDIHLMNIAVHPERRGKGYGHYLLTRMIETGASMGIETVWLEVRPSNPMAIMLYEKIGFEKIGRRSKYYRDTKEDAVVMRLSLRNRVRTGQETEV